MGVFVIAVILTFGFGDFRVLFILFGAVGSGDWGDFHSLLNLVELDFDKSFLDGFLNGVCDGHLLLEFRLFGGVLVAFGIE